MWLRLSADTIKQYCNTSIIEAWCLQYNQHLGKTLLLPVEEPKSILDQVITETILRKLPEVNDRSVLPIIQFNKSCNFLVPRRKQSTDFTGDFQVIKCGASGHNVRSRPSLKAPPVGMLVLGNRVRVSEYVVNADGCWVLLDDQTKEKYCFNTDGDAWSLAMGHNNVLYLGTLGENVSQIQMGEVTKLNANKRGFNFEANLPEPCFIFGNKPPPLINEQPSYNPFVFGDRPQEPPKLPRKDKFREEKLTNLPKWFKRDDGRK